MACSYSVLCLLPGPSHGCPTEDSLPVMLRLYCRFNSSRSFSTDSSLAILVKSPCMVRHGRNIKFGYNRALGAPLHGL